MFIDAYYDKSKDSIYVVERDETGTRQFKTYPANYTFYYEDKKGVYRTIYGVPCSKFTTNSYKKYSKELYKFKSMGKIFEHDVKPLNRCLETNYKNAKAPKLNIAFFDIEVDFHDEKGFALPEDPFNKVTAISTYCSWLDKCFTFVLKPNKVSQTQAEEMCNKFDDTYLCETEEELLKAWVELIQDADILTGWNSEGFDIPYLVRRMYMILNRDYVKKLCHWSLKPVERKFERFGKEQITYNLIGRVHLDYLQIYRKYTYNEMHSYALDAIADYVLKERKVPYEGTLDELYNYDFEKFIEYSRQDTILLLKLEKKLGYIDLTNQVAHENNIKLDETLGAVKLTDQAITNEYHDNNMIVPSRDSASIDDEDTYEDDTFYLTLTDEEKEEYQENVTDINNTIVGAYVAEPKKGMHEWLGSIDIKSLYPSIIRALNISPETIVGQLDPTETQKSILEKMSKGMKFAEAWAGLSSTLEYTDVMNKSKRTIDVLLEDGTKLNMEAREIYQMVFLQDSGLCLTANGTLYNKNMDGIVAKLVTRWFNERIQIQKEAEAKEIIWGEMIKIDSQSPEAQELHEVIKFLNKRALIKKIQLNSLYGAITNKGSRYFDQRMGQSITLSGRCIAIHMASTVNQILAKNYDHLGQTIVAGDTDSVIFSIQSILPELIKNGFDATKENIIELCNGVAKEVNNTFASFMVDKFNTTEQRGKAIVGNRELVATRGIWVKKKKYAAMVIDKDGIRYDVGNEPGLLKIMGLDTQRSDTPKFIQKFLKEMLQLTLVTNDEKQVLDLVREFRSNFAEIKPWELGTPKRVNKLTYYTNLENQKANSRLPGHVRAAYNWNRLRDMMSDRRSPKILDGAKVLVCKLKSNTLDYTSICYPIDIQVIPKWFKELPFDREKMKQTILDKKVYNLIGVLGWDLGAIKQSAAVKNLFDFD